MWHYNIRCTLGLVMLMAALSSPAFAAPHMADFTLGINREETLIRAAEPCGDNLCGTVAFGGQEWLGTFSMDNDTLSAITIMGPLNSDYMNAAFQGFKDSPYIVYRVISDVDCFDFIQESKTGKSPAELEAAFTSFLAGLREKGNGFASYFYTDPDVYEKLKKAEMAQTAQNGQESQKKISSKAADCLPVAYPEKLQGVACCLSIDNDGITIIIMPWQDMQRKLAAKKPVENKE